jgi:hypothetical protein
LTVSNFSQDFLAANVQAVSFLIKVYNTSHWLHLVHDVQSEYVDNDKTQEKLVIKGVEDEYLTISRYPMKVTLEWIEEMEQSVKDIEDNWNYGYYKRTIMLNFRF